MILFRLYTIPAIYSIFLFFTTTKNNMTDFLIAHEKTQ